MRIHYFCYVTFHSTIIKTGHRGKNHLPPVFLVYFLFFTILYIFSLSCGVVRVSFIQ